MKVTTKIKAGVAPDCEDGTVIGWRRANDRLTS